MTVSPQDVFDAVDLLGVLTNGILGGTLARSRRFDPVGFVVLGIASGLGGGMIRDVLLQAGPAVALTNSAYLVTALVGALVAFLLPIEGRWLTRFLIVADALSLGCWAATGTGKALAHDITWLPAILLGCVTAVGGGVVRDVLVRRVPVVFGGNTLYATPALVGSIVMAVLATQGHPQWGMGAAIVTVTAFCLVARRRGWALPVSSDEAPVRLRRSREER